RWLSQGFPFPFKTDGRRFGNCAFIDNVHILVGPFHFPFRIFPLLVALVPQLCCPLPASFVGTSGVERIVPIHVVASLYSGLVVLVALVLRVLSAFLRVSHPLFIPLAHKVLVRLGIAKLIRSRIPCPMTLFSVQPRIFWGEFWRLWTIRT